MQTLRQQLLVSSSLSTSASFAVAMKIPLLLLLLDMICFCHGVGYSYTRFVGPVTGPEEKHFLRNEHTGIDSVDYVGYPKYQFSYGVEDAEQRMLQNRKETRDGDNVQGVYSVVDPDGSLRVVKYTADDVNGFQAEVITNGVTSQHGNSNLNDNQQNFNNAYWQEEARVPHEEIATESSHDDDDDEDDEEGETEGHSHEYEEYTDYNNNKSYENDEYEEKQAQDGSSEEENFEDAD